MPIPLIIPSLAKGTSDGRWVDLEKVFAFGRGASPTPYMSLPAGCVFGPPRRDVVLVCFDALPASISCKVLPDLWFPPHFALLTVFSLSAWDAKVAFTSIQNTRNQEMKLVRQDQQSSSISSTCDPYSASFQTF